jgi:hypothetical protein
LLKIKQMEYLFYIALGWFVIEFEPFKMVALWINEKTGRKPVIEYMFGVLDCWQCATFWSTLLFTFSFKTAIVASFLTFVFEILNQWLNRR